MIIGKLNLRNENLSAFLVILLVSIIFLFPALCGKVDNPVDFRDANMYPWAYYSVDKKINVINLWDSSYKNEYQIISKPNSLSDEKFRIDLNKNQLMEVADLKPSNTNLYFNFSFKAMLDKNSDLNIEVHLLDPSDVDYKFPPEVVKLVNDTELQNAGWYQAYISLNGFINKTVSLEALASSSLKIVIGNNSHTSANTFLIKGLKLVCEDYSKAVKVHNIWGNDLIQGFTPIREFYSDSIKRRKIPFWNSYILTGVEFINGEPQMGYFHPLYFLNYLIFDHFTAHLMVTFISFILCGFGAYLLAKYWGLCFTASLLSGIVYMFHPKNVFLFSFEHMIMTSAALPFLLLNYEKNLKEARILNKYLIYSALLLGLILLSGHLQIVYYTMLFFLFFAFYRLVLEVVFNKDSFIKHAISILFILFISFMISAVVLIPFFPFLQNSHRVAFPDQWLRQASLPIMYFFLDLINPHWIHTNDTSYFYFGILPFIISLLSFSMRFQKSLVVFFLISITVSLLICTGSPIFFMIKDFIPGFKQLQHHRFTEFISYSVPFLAGIGLQVLINLITFLNKKIIYVILILIISFTAVELMYHSCTYVTWSDRNSYKPLPQGGSLEFFLNDQKLSKEPFRILSVVDPSLKTKVAIPNTLFPYRIEDVSGYNSFVPKDIYSLLLYIQTKNPNVIYSNEIYRYFWNFNIPYPISNYRSKVIDLLNVKYFLTPNFLILDSADAKKVYSGDCNIYENKGYLPRAFVVPTYKEIASPKETIIYLDSENFDPQKEVILMISPDVPSAAALPLSHSPQAFDHKIDFLKYDQDSITLKVNINQPGFLVLGNNLSDNWKVKVNNKQSQLLQANLVQRAVYLPSSGDYSIEFYYYSKRFLICMTITCLGFLILIFLGIYLRLSKVWQAP